jgi:hypothetical protein
VLLSPFLLLGIVRSARPAYDLNAARSAIGAYAYLDEYSTDFCPPPAGTGFDGDVGKAVRSFADGALTDAVGPSPGRSVGFPHNSRDTQVRTVLVDLGQTVVLDRVVVRSRLRPWQTISYFQLALATTLGSFGPCEEHPGAGTGRMPHADGLAACCAVRVAGRPARYLRFRFAVPPWNHVQLDQIDIAAHTPAGSQPLRSFDLGAFERSVRAYVRAPAIDALGQWARDDWPGKVGRTTELVRRHRADEAKYSCARLDLGRQDRFGGERTLGIPARPAGKWRLEKIGGRWWFVTPEGNPFLMNAMDGLHCWGPTTVEHPGKPGLRSLFAWLPAKKEGPLAPAWYDQRPGEGVWRFDFCLANRIRVYGDRYREGFYDTLERRLRAWGFNSLGKWSEISYRHVLEKLGRPMPYILPAAIAGEAGADIPCYGEVADPWDPRYAPAVEKAVRGIADQYRNDPFLVGLSFYGEAWWDEAVTARVLKSSPPLPAKRAFVEQLERGLREIDAVNRRCGTRWKSFDAMLLGDLSPHQGALEPEIGRFVDRTSRRFYGAWRSAIDRYDPGRLLLGSCFVPGWQVQPEWIRGSVPACDALMLDWYEKDVPRLLAGYVERFAVPADRPVLIGEIGFTTPRYGFKPGLNSCQDQDQRGRWYRYVYENLYAHPHWVGTMYFHYLNQPLPGRDVDAGGEAWQFGLVDVCDLPYEEFIRHVTEANRRLAQVHAGVLPSTTRQQLGLPSPAAAAVDNSP